MVSRERISVARFDRSRSRAELSSSFGGRGTSLLLVQKRSTQEKTPPHLRALRASMPARFAVGLRGLSTGHPALTPNWPASMPATLRAFPPPARRFRGAPGRAARSKRALFRRAKSQQIKSQSHGRACFALAVAFSFSPSAGHEGPLLYPGPLCGGELGTTGPQGNRQGCRFLFVRTGVLSKSPAPAHVLAGHGCPASAKRGGLSLWLAFSLATQRESNSGAVGARKLLLLQGTTTRPELNQPRYSFCA